MNIRKLVLTCALTLASSMTLAAETPFAGAENVSTESLYAATTGEVILTFISKTAAYSNDLYLQGDSDSILNNQTAIPGSIYSLGSFEAGTELVFSIFVNGLGDIFYNGPANKNFDNTIHSAYQEIDNSVFVGFEDIAFGGDRDYDDLVFSLSNVTIGRPVVSPVPEPEIVSMLAAGLMLLGFSNRKKS